MASDELEDVEVEVLANLSQSHTLFLRGDIPLLVTGLSVGLSFFDNGVPVQIVNSYVCGMTCLVTREKKITTFSQLKGETILLPFQGSPIEEITRFFVRGEELEWKKDITVLYSPIETALELLRKDRVSAVVIPQPFVALAVKSDNFHVSIDYYQRWNQVTDSLNGYPQVATFANRDWLRQNREIITRLNKGIAQAISKLKATPDLAKTMSNTIPWCPGEIIQDSIAGTYFELKTSQDLRQYIEQYYQIIGSPLNESHNAFFYINS